MSYYIYHHKILTFFNLYFIKLRLLTSCLMIFSLITIKYLNILTFSSIQWSTINLTIIAICIYNCWFYCHLAKTRLRKLSVLQITFDLLCLVVLIVVTGGIESPLLLLGVFHMIISGLIIEQKKALKISFIYFSTIILIFNFQFHSIIPHYPLIINGLLYKSFDYLLFFSVAYGIMLFGSMLISDYIAKNVYQREKKLVDSFRHISEQEKIKQKYLIAVIHELKSPISAAITQVKLITDGYLGEIELNLRERLKHIAKRLDSLLEDINNIIYYSRIKLLNKLDFNNTNFTKILKNVLKNYESLIYSKKINTNFPDLSNDIFISGDERLLELAISNVISNAIKYSPEKSKIEISLKESKDGLCLSVSDSGIGILPEEQNKVFKDFYRARNARNANIEGTGTGLSLVKDILDRHNAKIKIISPNHLGNSKYPGTTFIVCFTS